MTKTPSLLRLTIEAYAERWRTRKAQRILKDQEWSIDFLTALLVKAAKASNQSLEMTLFGPKDIGVRVRTLTASPVDEDDDDIFNHLDDERRIQQFIESIK